MPVSATAPNPARRRTSDPRLIRAAILDPKERIGITVSSSLSSANRHVKLGEFDKPDG
jgi:hypothetical protein